MYVKDSIILQQSHLISLLRYTETLYNIQYICEYILRYTGKNRYLQGVQKKFMI